MYILWIFLTLVITIIVLMIRKILQKITYWKQSKVPLINVPEFVRKIMRKPCGIVVHDYYQQMFRGQQPFQVIEAWLFSLVIVQDLEAIKDIMITNFEHFPDRGFYVNRREALSSTILRLGLDAWKPLRQKISPMLSPAKVKYMFPTVQEVASRLELLVAEHCANGPCEFEVYNLCARYTTDVVGSVIFGIECNSLKNPNTEFRIQGDKSIYQLFNPCKEQFAAKFSKILNFFNYKVFDKQTSEFFTQIVKETVQYREKNHIRRPDLLDLLIQMKNSDSLVGELPVTLDLIAGQVFGLFQAGFETSASTMNFALFEIAKNQEIQRKLRQEILEVISNNEGNVCYENLKKMVYLKQVIMGKLSIIHPCPDLRHKIIFF